MLNVTARPGAAKMALNLDGVTRPSPDCQSFRDDVERLLSTQQHQYSAPEQQRVLKQLSEKIKNMPSDMLTERVRAAGAGAFITQLKQEKLNELNRDLGEYALCQAGTNVSMAITEMETALAQKRLPALMLCRDAVIGDKYLLTCLDEHIAAAQKKSTTRDALRLIKQCPDILNALDEKTHAYSSRLNETVMTVKNNAKALLEEMVRTATENNKALIASNSEQIEREIDNRIRALGVRESRCEDIKDSYARRKEMLDSLAKAITSNNKEMLANLAKVTILNETDISGTLRSSLQTFCTTQEEVIIAVRRETQACQEQTRGLIAPEDSPELQTISDRIEEEKQALAGEQTASQNAARAVSNGSGMGDLLLRCKRLFGAGKREKTRSEHRVVQRQHDAAQEKHAQRIDALRGSYTQKLAALNESYTKEVQRRRLRLNDLHQKAVTLQATEAQQQSALLDKISTEMDSLEAITEQKKKESHDIYGNLREKFVTRQEEFEEATNALIEDNEKLAKMLTKEPFSCLSVLQERFAGQPALAQFEQYHAQYQDINAGRHELQKHITSLNQVAADLRYLKVRMPLGGKDDWSDKGTSIRTTLNLFGIDLKDFFSDRLPSLTDAANLYAMLCVEQVHGTPFLQEIRKAESVSDETLKSLSSLESMMNTPEWIPQGDNNQYRPGKSPAEIMGNIKNTISGLKKIIGNDLNDVLVSKADFTDQLYHPEKNIYIDRQGQHGTCVMHSWNNLISSVTDNQKMMLTPWRLEKLIQSLVVHEANVKLKDILTASPRPPLAVINTALKQIIQSSELCHPEGYRHLTEHGYMMEHEDDTHLIIKSNLLAQYSPRIFNLLNIRNEPIRLCIGKNINADKRSDVLNTLQDKNYDAINICFSGSSINGHELALLKKGNSYLLVDSNYDDPIPMTLSQLVDFFCTDHASLTLPETINGQPASGGVSNLMRKRGYGDYSQLIFDLGLYKDKEI
ncbi:hypothetical protein ACQYE5_003082 [Enterobacter cancerogenus]